MSGIVQTNNATVDKELLKAERDYMGGAATGKYNTSKDPVWFIRADYGKVDLFKPNTWSIYGFYLYQPALRQFSDSNEFDNMKGFRFGAAYTIMPGFLLEGYATFAKDIDTHERRRDVRGQLNMFF